MDEKLNTDKKNIHPAVSLNGAWKFIKDPGQELTYGELLKSVDNWNNLEEMKLPVNWQLAGLHNFNGAVWFLKKIDISKHDLPGKLVMLHFKGIDYFADVWLNDLYIGNHEGYFQPFHFDVSDFIKIDKTNLLVVKVTSPFEDTEKDWPDRKKLIKGIFNHHDCRPGGWSKKYGQDQNTGGIWNDTYLKSYNHVFVSSIKVKSKIYFDDNFARLQIEVCVFSRFVSAIEDIIELNMLSSGGREFYQKYSVLIIPGKNKFLFTFEINNPELWWSWDLGGQNLYQLQIKGAEIEKNKIVFGIREVSIDADENFYLNRKKLFLRGTNIIPTQFLSELTEEKIFFLINIISDANINIIRMHAHVNREEFYNECDRRGVLVWQDFALQWTYNESSRFISNAVTQIKEMVDLLFNHPSIAFWCCHNEPGEQINKIDPLLHDAVLSEDNSRIIRLASNYEEHAYDGWYWGNKEHFAAVPMGPLVTEFGAQAIPELSSLEKFIPPNSLYPPSWDRWKYHNFQYEQTFQVAEINYGNSAEEFIQNSQEYQADLIKTAVDFYRREKNKKITGIFQFMFVDCWPSITWSVVDYFGKKKLGYYALQKAFQPLYISVGLRQKIYYPSQKLNIDIWLINDFHKSFISSTINFSVNFKSIGMKNVELIPADSNLLIDCDKLNISLPSDLMEGTYLVSVELLNKNKEALSKNEFKITVRNRI